VWVRMRRIQSPFLAVALSLYAIAASAEQPAPTGRVVPVFSIAKSENKNQVQYVVRLDDHCAPWGPEPLSAYWRMLEQGPTQTAPILPREVPGGSHWRPSALDSARLRHPRSFSSCPPTRRNVGTPSIGPITRRTW
jgi:hypothetical protein